VDYGFEVIDRGNRWGRKYGVRLANKFKTEERANRVCEELNNLLYTHRKEFIRRIKPKKQSPDPKDRGK